MPYHAPRLLVFMARRAAFCEMKLNNPIRGVLDRLMYTLTNKHLAKIPPFSTVGKWCFIPSVLFVIWIILSGFLHRPSDAEVIHSFDIIAFGNEFTGERFSKVRKWVEPIRVGIQGEVPNFLEADVRQHIGELNQITGHPVELYYSYAMEKSGLLAKDFNRNKVNVVLLFLDKAKIQASILKYFDYNRLEVDRMIQSSICFAKFFKRNSEIRSAVVIFPASHSREVMRACVVEELTQIMGLPNDSDLVPESIFNDHSPYNELTKLDKLMLRILYDRRITVGMDKNAALKTAQKILYEIQR